MLTEDFGSMTWYLVGTKTFRRKGTKSQINPEVLYRIEGIRNRKLGINDRNFIKTTLIYGSKKFLYVFTGF